MSFDNLKLNRQLLNAISDQGYTKPTEIQIKSIPQIMAGQDVVGIAQTGTGKTAAFLLPLLMKTKFRNDKGPRVLILEPTRELSIQVGEECEKLCAYLDLDFLSIYGGIGPKTQIETIKNGVDILIATPGRLMDIYKKGALQTKYIKHIVIDEADRMLDMGFLRQINGILEIIPQKTQNMIYSATMPSKVRELADDFLKFPIALEVTPSATPAETVQQNIYHIPNHMSKINMLKHILETEESLDKVLIFAKTKKNADDIYKFIDRKVTKSVKVIHSNKGQNSRINAINALKNGDIQILVSTDVTARGIDIKKVSHVINFDTPTVYEDYVHRIGRTGRAFNTGNAITLANEVEEHHVRKIEEIINMEIPVSEIPKEVVILATPKEEQQELNILLDHLRRKLDPDFKGAFHEKQFNRSKNKK